VRKLAAKPWGLRAFSLQEDRAMKQPHTEKTVAHTDDEQNTGNHKKPGAQDAGGADKRGGTRAGAENVEHEGGRNQG
jgi:hypothetical protein